MNYEKFAIGFLLGTLVSIFLVSLAGLSLCGILDSDGMCESPAWVKAASFLFILCIATVSGVLNGLSVPGDDDA